MKIQVKENIYWIGVNDRETKKFENTISSGTRASPTIPMIDDEKIAIIDAVKLYSDQRVRQNQGGYW